MTTTLTNAIRAAGLIPRIDCLNNSPLISGLFQITNIFVGLTYVAIASVLLLDRAAATRAMFDNRLAFGAFIILCAWSRFVATFTIYVEIFWLEAATMAASCIVAIIVAWVTLSTLRVKPKAPT